MNRILFVIFGILLTAISCGDKTDKDIIQLMEQRKTAYSNKNIELYSSILSENYLKKTKDGDEKIDTAVKNFKVNTTPFDIIDMKHKDRSIYKNGDKAKVVQKTYVVLEIDNKKNNFEITEILMVAKENGSWKITKESNLDLFRGYVFGKGE